MGKYKDFVAVHDASVLLPNTTGEYGVYHVRTHCIAGVGYVAAEGGKIVVELHVDLNDKFFATVVGGVTVEDYDLITKREWDDEPVAPVEKVQEEDKTGDGISHEIRYGNGFEKTDTVTGLG